MSIQAEAPMEAQIMTTLKQLEALMAQATPLPWPVFETGSPDFQLMVSATNALPSLMDLASAARSLLDALDSEIFKYSEIKQRIEDLREALKGPHLSLESPKP